MASDDELSRLAEEALLREAKRGAQRAEVSGPSGWLRCRLPSTNKTFLQNTLLGTLAANRAKDKQEKIRIENNRRKRQIEEKERNTYKRVYIQASTKPKKSQVDMHLESSETLARNETKQAKNGDREIRTDVKKKEKSKQKFVWNEDGLELTQHVTDSNHLKKSKGSDSASQTKSVHKVLPRNIKFVPSGSRSSYDGERR